MINFETKWYKVETVDNYTRIIHKNTWNNRPFAGVVILPIINDKILLLEVFRYGTNRLELEFPRGCSEPNQSPELNAVRELEEEINASIFSIDFLGTSISDTTWGTGDVYHYFVKLNNFGNLQAEEQIKNFKLLTKDELFNLIENNKIQDAFTLTTITKAISKGFL